MSKIFSIMGVPMLLGAACGAQECEMVADCNRLEESLERVDLMDMFDRQSKVGYLSEADKEDLLRKIKFAFKKMSWHLSEAEYQAEGIKSIDVREAALAAIGGAIAGLKEGPYGVVTGACLGALARIVYGSSLCFIRAMDHVCDADFYACKCDDWIRIYERGYW